MRNKAVEFKYKARLNPFKFFKFASRNTLMHEKIPIHLADLPIFCFYTSEYGKSAH